jgi:hypothetical protein
MIGGALLPVKSMAKEGPFRVMSAAFCNRRPRRDFRYTPLATKLARHCNMSRRARTRTSPGARAVVQNWNKIEKRGHL